MTYDIRAKLYMDNADYEKKLRRAAKQTESFGKSVKTISNGIKTAFVGVGLNIISNLFTDFVKGAELARQSDQKLQRVAKSMGMFGKSTDTVTQSLIKYADQLELSTGFTAEGIKQVQTTLLTFKNIGKSAGVTGGLFERTTEAALDLAAAGFGSIESNAKQLGKALQDPIKGLTALTKSGVTFTKKERDRIKVLVESNRLGKAQEIIMSAIEKQVGGVAEASGLASAKLQNAFGQITDAIGEQFLPVLDELVAWFQSDSGKKAIADFAGEAKKLGEWFMSPEGKKAMQGWMDDLKTMIKLAGDFLGLVTGVTNLLGNTEKNQKSVLSSSAGRTALNPFRGGLGYTSTADMISKTSNMAAIGGTPAPIINIKVDPITGDAVAKLLKGTAQKRGITVGKMIQ